MKTKAINIRIGPGLYEQAKRQADSEHRSLANFVEMAIIKHLEKLEREEKKS